MNKITELQHDIERHIAICGDLATENEKLRTALEEIAEMYDPYDEGSAPTICRIAREALAKERTGYTWCEVVHVSDTEGTRGRGFMALVPNSTLAKEEK